MTIIGTHQVCFTFVSPFDPFHRILHRIHHWGRLNVKGKDVLESGKSEDIQLVIGTGGDRDMDGFGGCGTRRDRHG